MTVTLVGTGNVAKHIFDAFLPSHKVTVSLVMGRNPEHLKYFGAHTRTTCNFKATISTDIVVIAVSDDAIAKVSGHFIDTESLIVHTSGSVHLQDLATNTTNRKGVFYPLQTFTQGGRIDFTSVPLCIEAAHRKDSDLLQKLASYISKNVHIISSEQRKSIHLAAVFVNNFTNHLYHIGEDICKKNGLPFTILKPLIRETSKKIESIAPKDAQTGPAKRDDKKTLELHINQLKNEDHENIYRSMTKSIQHTYGKKL